MSKLFDLQGLDQIPVLGSGVGYREPWFGPLTSAEGNGIDFLEITADHFMDAPRWKIDQLKKLKESFTLIPHSLDLSIGSSEGIDKVYLEKLARIIEFTDPPYWSEHLAFTKAGGLELGHLAPLPFSNEAVDAVSANVEKISEVIEIPLILENITYGVNMPGHEMSEAEFISKVFDASGCGWLLDVTNLHVNSVNHSFDPLLFLQQTPTERVVQLHYVGFTKNARGYLIDDHGNAVDEEIWELMDEVLRQCSGVKGTILERDSKLPSFNEIMDETDRARSLGKKYNRWD
ncbi:MAG: DUF692 domain-containing protein [Verrucomicrobiales bacterium]